MGSRSEFSAQTLSVLAALCEQPSQWRHGYELAKQTGLKSGTLYPILIRLADRGLMEAHWQDEQQAGRPRRHLYRLTPEGLATAERGGYGHGFRQSGARSGPHQPISATTPGAGLVMDGLTRVMAGLLRRSMAVVPAGRREWAEAVWSEAAEVPPGWRRLAWLAGGLRLTAREAARGRKLGYPLSFTAAAAGTAWSAWSGPPSNAAIVINRVDVITMVVILAALPWVIGRACGPVSASLQARLLRTGGYAAVLALVLVKTAVRRVADAPPNNLGGTTSAWIGEVIFLAVMAGYAAVILAATARRSPAVPAAVTAGTVAGTAIGVLVYTLGPLGFPLRFSGPWPPRLTTRHWPWAR